MSFFTGQESLSIFQWALRGIVGYLFLLIVAKAMGQRSISQLRLLDFVTALVLGNIIAHPLSDQSLGMLGSMITSLSLVFLYIMGTFLSLKSEPCRKFLESTPVLIVKNGQILEKGLAKARISLESLLSELRKSRIANIQHVALAYWEPGGSVSIFLENQFRPATPADLQIPTAPFSLPRVVIREGKIKNQALQKTGKDEQWLREKLSSMAIADLRDILLATLDGDNLYVFMRSSPPK